MSDDAYQNLKREIALFRQWADSPEAGRYGEWETNYQKWDVIRSEFKRYISHVAYSGWSKEVTVDILYIIARDNESELLVDNIAEEPSRLIFLARIAAISYERNAQWQLADRLGNLMERAAEAESVLLNYFDQERPLVDESDPREYIQRRALMALGRLKSPAVATLASAAWATGYESQRKVVLSALQDAGSPQLEGYLVLAEHDDNPWVKGWASWICEDNSW